MIVYIGDIYSLLLESDQDDGAHGVEVGGVLAATLGRGVVGGEGSDVRAHPFFAGYEKVL